MTEDEFAPIAASLERRMVTVFAVPGPMLGRRPVFRSLFPEWVQHDHEVRLGWDCPRHCMFRLYAEDILGVRANASVICATLGNWHVPEPPFSLRVWAHLR